MRFFKAGTATRTPEDEMAFARLTAIANRLKPQDSTFIEVEPIADEPSADTEPDTLQ